MSDALSESAAPPPVNVWTVLAIDHFRVVFRRDDPKRALFAALAGFYARHPLE